MSTTLMEFVHYVMGTLLRSSSLTVSMSNSSHQYCYELGRVLQDRR